MSFNKLAPMVTMIGRIVRTAEVSLPAGTIADIKDSYKYLGILQANGNLKEATRKSARNPWRVRQVLRSHLTGKNKGPEINTYAD